jgi:transcriptional regulator with XRE-family HTH domain
MKQDLKIQAQDLRRKGTSIKEIARLISVSQSSVSRWCKDIELTPEQKVKLDAVRKEAGLKALTPWIEKNKHLKSNDMQVQKQNGENDIDKVSDRDLFILGLGLYWGEGYKKGSQELGFTNSDPQIILVFMEWLTRNYQISRDQLIARVTINARYSENAEEIQDKWATITGISRTQFTKPSFIKTKPNSIIRSSDTYVGTLRLKVRNGTSLRRRILASIASLSTKLVIEPIY